MKSVADSFFRKSFGSMYNPAWVEDWSHKSKNGSILFEAQLTNEDCILVRIENGLVVEIAHQVTEYDGSDNLVYMVFDGAGAKCHTLYDSSCSEKMINDAMIKTVGG